MWSTSKFRCAIQNGKKGLLHWGNNVESGQFGQGIEMQMQHVLVLLDAYRYQLCWQSSLPSSPVLLLPAVNRYMFTSGTIWSSLNCFRNLILQWRWIGTLHLSSVMFQACLLNFALWSIWGFSLVSELFRNNNNKKKRDLSLCMLSSDVFRADGERTFSLQPLHVQSCNWAQGALIPTQLCGHSCSTHAR